MIVQINRDMIWDKNWKNRQGPSVHDPEILSNQGGRTMRTYLSARDCRAILALTDRIYTLPDREQVFGAVADTLRTLVPYSSAVYLAMNTVGFREEGHILLGVGVKELEAFTGYYAALHPFTRSGWIHHANAAARITDFVPASRIPDTEYGRDFMTRVPFSWETGVILQTQGEPVGALCLHRQKPDRIISIRSKWLKTRAR